MLIHDMSMPCVFANAKTDQNHFIVDQSKSEHGVMCKSWLFNEEEESNERDTSFFVNIMLLVMW